MHTAAENGHLELISALVEHGANLERGADTQKNTAIQYAFYNREVEAARVLIRLGADIRHVDITGRNTADLAIKGAPRDDRARRRAGAHADTLSDYSDAHRAEWPTHSGTHRAPISGRVLRDRLVTCGLPISTGGSPQ